MCKRNFNIFLLNMILSILWFSLREWNSVQSVKATLFDNFKKKINTLKKKRLVEPTKSYCLDEWLMS